jgi:DNA uptake protein ComE-like DNA-binding protein
MSRRLVPVILGLIALGATAARADDDKKNNEVEVKFIDGSTVRMVLIQESIEVITKFGKLSIPVSEIRGIDMGVHLPEGMEDKIQALIKQLNSDKFKDRDAAVNALVEMGARAYPALFNASKNADLEVQQRVQTALKKIKAAVPENMLRLSSQDRIITTEFPIVGQIVSPDFKVKTQYFGDLNLKLTELRSVAWVSGNLNTELAVEAAKYAVKDQWLDTNVTLADLYSKSGRNAQAESLLNKMIQNGAQGTDDEFGAILDYLSTNFPPVPEKINVNTATAWNLRNWLNFSEKQANAVVDYRKQNGDFKSLDDLKKHALDLQ